MLGFGNSSSESKVNQLDASTPVNDLSTLVKRKVKEVVKEDGAQDKNQKLE
jgi:hypothetical protein